MVVVVAPYLGLGGVLLPWENAVVVLAVVVVVLAVHREK